MGQVEIGSDIPPAPDAEICDIPIYLDPDGTNNTSGYLVGDTVDDFILFDIENTPYQLSQTLEEKPVLIVSGSYTCPRFRGNVNAIEIIRQEFGDEIDILIVYCVEAHPHTQVSPYFGFVNPAWINTQAGIIYNQPDIYQDRIDVVSTMLDSMNINVPVLLDTPCNDWWDHYGPAENNAYIIDQSGEVIVKHGWMNNFALNMYQDIDAFLNGTSQTTTYGGSVELGPSDEVGESLTAMLQGAEVRFENPDTSWVAVDIIRTINFTPPEWEFSLCSGICYNPTVDSIRVDIAPEDDIHLVVYAYPNGVSGEAEVCIRATNVDDTENFEEHTILFSSSYSSIEEIEISYTRLGDTLVFPENITSVHGFSLSGQHLKATHSNQISLDGLKGVIILKAVSQNGVATVKLAL